MYGALNLTRITSPPNSNTGGYGLIYSVCFSYFLFIFCLTRCTLPDFHSVSSLTSLLCSNNNNDVAFLLKCFSRNLCSVLTRNVCSVLTRYMCSVLTRNLCSVLTRNMCSVLTQLWAFVLQSAEFNLHNLFIDPVPTTDLQTPPPFRSGHLDIKDVQ